MSRIDDALRRAGGAPETAARPTEPTEGMFVSPWVVSEPAPASTVPSVAIRTRDVQRVEVPTPRLRVVRPAAVESFADEWRPRLAVGEAANPAVGHQFRRLAAALIQAQRARPIKTILVTSASAGDGKTLTALNLALVLSESYKRRVLLVEADLHRPMIANIAMLPATEGLADLIRRPDEQKATLIQITDALTLLPAGRIDGDPLSGLTSARMQHRGQAFVLRTIAAMQPFVGTRRTCQKHRQHKPSQHRAGEREAEEHG